MRGRMVRHLGLSWMLATVFLGWYGAPAHGQDEFSQEQQPAPLTVSLEYEEAGERLNLIATATDAAGTPVGMRAVEFFVVPEFFGRRAVKIGQAKTNVIGKARILWAPTLSGPVEVKASVAGDDRFQAAEWATTLDLPPLEADAVVEDHSPGRPFVQLRTVVGRTVGAVAIGVWVLLMTVLGLTVGTIRRYGLGKGVGPTQLPGSGVGRE